MVIQWKMPRPESEGGGILVSLLSQPFIRQYIEVFISSFSDHLNYKKDVFSFCNS